MIWRSRGAARLAATFMLGVACAIWLLPVIAGPRVQQLRLERDESRSEVEALRGEVLKLKESLQEQNQVRPLVKRAQVEIHGVDDRVRLAVQSRIQKQLHEEQVGRPLDDISPVLLLSRLQGKESLMEVDGVRYQLEVKLLVIGPELMLFAELSPVKGD